MGLESLGADLRVIVVGTLAEAVEKIGPPGLLITCLDLSLPDSDGFSGVLTMQRLAAGVPIVVISAYDQPEVARQAFALGAAAFLSKAVPITTMIDAFRAVLRGERWFPELSDEITDGRDDDHVKRLRDLTGAQRRVLDAMASGRLNKQIAHDLGISEITVKAHVKEILRKLGVGNRTQAILLDQTLSVRRSPFAIPTNPKG